MRVAGWIATGFLALALGCAGRPVTQAGTLTLPPEAERYAAGCEQVFDEWDADHDAAWTLAEFRAGQAPLKRWSDREIDALFGQLAPAGRLARADALLRCEALREFSRPIDAAPRQEAPAPGCEALLGAYDADRDGGLSESEFAAFLRGLGSDPALAGPMIGTGDADGDSRLGPTEYCAGVSGSVPGPAASTGPETCKDFLARLDRSGDREVTLAEFLASIDYTRFRTTTPEQVFKHADADESQTLNEREICREADGAGIPYGPDAYDPLPTEP